MEGKFLGEIQPIYGRWHWPFHTMQPGQYFIVDKVKRSGEQVRHHATVRAAQLGIPLSVTVNDPEHPGFTRVTYRDGSELNQERPHGAVIEYGLAAEKMAAWYGYDLDEMPFGMLGVKGNEVRIDRPQLVDPMVSAIMFDHSQKERTAVAFDKQGFTLYALSQHDTFKSWQPPKREPTLEELMS